jgi:hypothetical protein
VESIAVVLNTCLHPALFPAAVPASGCSALQRELHGPGGPVAQVVDRLISLGTGVPRVAAMAATQLCSHLLRAPQLAHLYLDQVRTLSVPDNLAFS